jgi:FkbM family methyltransferase
MIFVKHIRRIIEIARYDGVIEAGMTAMRELIGQLLYKWLQIIKPHGYYLRDVQGSKMCLAIDDKGVSRDLIIRGMRERMETRMIQKVLSPGMVVIDVGSNIGYYALIEARAVFEKGHVYAIEPEPNNVKLLRQNVELNGYKHVDVFQAGISDETGIAKMYVSEHSNLHNLLRPLHAKNNNSVIEIKVYRLDDFVEENRIDPESVSLIRMDIEGYEVKALTGMIETMRKAKMLKLFIEFHPQYIKNIEGYSLESTMEMLAELGFKIRYATATSRHDGMLQFQNITIQKFIADERVSRDRVFMTFLEKKSPTNHS